MKDLFVCLMLVSLFSWSSSAFAQNNTIFGPNVYVFSPSNSVSSINSTLATLASNAQFSTNRYAVFFAPGTYTGVQSEVGFYESIAGLGQTPSAVNISQGYLQSNQTINGNDTQTFWRSMENMEMTTPGSGTLQWGVSQGASIRRMLINNPVELTDSGCNYSSGGFIANTQITGQVNSCSQQQWYTRSSSLGSWTGGSWNMVFSGVSGAPGQSSPFGGGGNSHTVLATTPVTREKPFLYMDSSSNYWVFSPSYGTNTSGTTWASGGVGNGEAGTSLPISSFLIATPSTSLATINGALASGQNLILTPGIYQYSGSINVTNANTVVLGLGYADIVPQSGTAALTVADVDGVQLAGFLIDAGPVNSPVLLQVGVNGAPRVSHASNPTSISDVHFRVGGATLGTCTEAAEIDSDNVIIDNMWSWRADHGNSGTVGWALNVCNNGLVVNGDYVVATGLAVEHYETEQVVWNGEGGETIFYQSEMPYDVPSQSAWMNGSVNGYASYNVAPTVATHTAYGLGVYSVFNQGVNIVANSGIAAPVAAGVTFHDMVSVTLASGQINFNITSNNNTVDNGGTTAGPNSYVTSWGGTNGNCGFAPSTPGTPSGSGTSSSTMYVTWGASTEGSNCTLSYNLFRSATFGFTPSSSNMIASDLTAASFADSGLASTTTYYYAVQAVNAAGTSANSAQGSGTTTGTSEGPYGGTPAAIPGTVLAENYDTGGQGVGYNVNSINGTDNSYRNDGVDLETTAAPGGGNDIGWTTTGQWFRFTVNVATAGTYNVTFKVASPNGANGGFHLSNASGTNLTGAVNVPATGGWQAWTTVTATVTLPAGQQVLTWNQDNAGYNLYSAAFVLTSEGPYGGTPAAIPGTVLASNYDTGGQGVGYNVNSVNGSNNSYRSDGVDLETTSAPGGGNDIGWTATGQWFRFTVNVATAGTYNVTFKVASPSGATGGFHLSNASGANMTGSVNVPMTGGWQTWTTVTASVTLPAGQQVLTWNQDNAGYNLYSAAFVLTSEGPYGGTPAAIRGTVLASNYDTGGQGVAYNVNSINGTGNSYRSDGVDLEATTDTGGGYDLGWTAAGQWFKYTVNVATAGTYTVTFRVAAQSAVTSAFHLSNSSGTNLSGSVSVPNTGGWQAWTNVTATVTLPAGLQTLILNQDNGGWNINYLSFTSGTTGGGPRLVGYLPDYEGSFATFAQTLNFNKMTHLNLAFGNPPLCNGTCTTSSNMTFALGQTNSAISTLVNAAHAAGVKVILSIGGGGGDKQIIQFYNAGLSSQLVASLNNYVAQFNLDGVDLDIEDPNNMGIPYATFAADLISTFHPQNKIVTAAVAQYLQSAMPTSTLLQFDFVNVMNYSNLSNAQTAMSYFSSLGEPNSKIVLGVPFFGQSADGNTQESYAKILAAYPGAGGQNQVSGGSLDGGISLYYVGDAMMAQETQLGVQYGGVMIWELSQDAAAPNSLLTIIQNNL